MAAVFTCCEIRHWYQFHTDMRVHVARNVPDSLIRQGTKFKAVYCNSNFECHTNIPYFMELNQCLTLTQPSTSDQNNIIDPERMSLSVPRLNFFSTVAYAHDIHTLVYYA